jgi:hypothetical protein
MNPPTFSLTVSGDTAHLGLTGGPGVKPLIEAEILSAKGGDPDDYLA